MYSWKDWNNVQHKTFFLKKEMCVQERFGYEKYIDYNWRVVGASGTVCEDQKLLLSCSMCWIWNAKVGALPRMPKTPCIIGHVSSEVCHAVVRSENCLTQTSTKADILDVPQDLPLHFLRRQTQTGIPKVKLEDQTLGPTQTLKMTQRKSHWLLSCDSSESMLNYSLTNIGVLPEKDKRGIHRHAICCQKKVNLRLISSLTRSDTVLNDDLRCVKTCLKFGWFYTNQEVELLTNTETSGLLQLSAAGVSSTGGVPAMR